MSLIVSHGLRDYMHAYIRISIGLGPSVTLLYFVVSPDNLFSFHFREYPAHLLSGLPFQPFEQPGPGIFCSAAFLLSSLLSAHMKNNTWVRVDMEFLLECLTLQLTSERSERVRCRVKHEKRNSKSTSNHVLFCLSYKHHSLSLARKVDFIDE